MFNQFRSSFVLFSKKHWLVQISAVVFFCFWFFSGAAEYQLFALAFPVLLMLYFAMSVRLGIEYAALILFFMSASAVTLYSGFSISTLSAGIAVIVLFVLLMEVFIRKGVPTRLVVLASACIGVFSGALPVAAVLLLLLFFGMFFGGAKNKGAAIAVFVSGAMVGMLLFGWPEARLLAGEGLLNNAVLSAARMFTDLNQMLWFDAPHFMLGVLIFSPVLFLLMRYELVFNYVPKTSQGFMLWFSCVGMVFVIFSGSVFSYVDELRFLVYFFTSLLLAGLYGRLLKMEREMRFVGIGFMLLFVIINGLIVLGWVS